MPHVVPPADEEPEIHKAPTFTPPTIAPSREEAEIHKPATFQPPPIRADAEPMAVRHDQEHRDAEPVDNPGQSEFEVRYEHESVWTTKPKRDAEQ